MTKPLLRTWVRTLIDLRRLSEVVTKIRNGGRLQRKDAWYRLVMQCRGIDLRWTSVEELGLSKERSARYSNSGGPSLDVVLRTLNISPTDSALDLGCGKGGAMISLARWPFRRVDGLDLSPEMITIARRNLRRLRCLRGTITHCDAAEFNDFDLYTVLYMFHPFPEVVMKSVLENIRASLTRLPRRITLIYKNPVCHELVVSSGFRQIRQFEHTSPLFRVYENVVEP